MTLAQSNKILPDYMLAKKLCKSANIEISEKSLILLSLNFNDFFQNCKSEAIIQKLKLMDGQVFYV